MGNTRAAFRLHERAVVFSLVAHRAQPTEYKQVEVVAVRKETVIGDFVEFSAEKRGTVLSAERGNIRLIQRATTKRFCLANMVKGLPEATTIVHIPDRSIKGEELDSTEWQNAFWWACDRYGVPTWTQSSIKSLTFYFIAEKMFDKLASKWNLAEDGAKFSSYIGLLFSEMTGDEPLVVEITKIAACDDGQDGNCAVSTRMYGNKTTQFRALKIDERDGMPLGLGKGIMSPVMGASDVPALNDSQIKWGKAGKYIILKNNNVNSDKRPIYISAEPVLMLKDAPEVRTFLADRTRKAVAEYVSLLSPENKPALLRRLGGLRLNESGELESSKRAVIEALRSDMPWCREIEERISRFAIRDIVDHIIPSGGIRGWGSVMVISDEHGTANCDWKDAKCFAIRVPVTGKQRHCAVAARPIQRGRGSHRDRRSRQVAEW